mmetsp:Transcript_31165/g.38042  ORF Transcript_31165/g.38042 Transcript_31165/m.38042 type:complete len:343 (+) Transcript_31165:93-1121(+)
MISKKSTRVTSLALLLSYFLINKFGLSAQAFQNKLSSSLFSCSTRSRRPNYCGSRGQNGIITTTPIHYQKKTCLSSSILTEKSTSDDECESPIVAASTVERATTLSLSSASFPPHPSKHDKKISSQSNPEDVPTTLPQAIQRFFFGRDIGPLCTVISISLFVTQRLQTITTPQDYPQLDALAACTAVVFWWFQEHVLHQKLLHSQRDWLGKSIHEGHHSKPYFHVSIDPPGLIMGWLLAVHVALRLLLPLPLALSATVGYAAAGLFYEWAHYIVHTRVVPRNGFMRKMRDNHMRHHLVSDEYWFGFSVPAIDDFFGTNPSVGEVRRRRKYADGGDGVREFEG